MVAVQHLMIRLSQAETVWLGNPLTQSPSYMSRGEYGVRVGMRRVLNLLDKHDIPASFFIPAMSMELHPGLVGRIKKNHAEITHHLRQSLPNRFLQNLGLIFKPAMLKILLQKKNVFPLPFNKDRAQRAS